LPELARLATSAGPSEEQAAMGAINAFCILSGACKPWAPAATSYGGGVIDPTYIKDGLAAIAKWRTP
jgi:hypothetical protein